MLGESGKAAKNMTRINIRKGSLSLLNQTKCAIIFIHDCRYSTVYIPNLDIFKMEVEGILFYIFPENHSKLTLEICQFGDSLEHKLVFL